MQLFKKKEKSPWENVTVGQLLELIKLQENKATFSEIFKVMTGKDVDSVTMLELRQATANLKFLSEEIPVTEIKKKYVINGHKYHLYGNLTKFTASQYIDYSNHINNKNDISMILSTVLVPKGHKYNDGYEMFDVINDIKKMSVVEANTIAFFMRQQSKLFFTIFQPYLETILEKAGVKGTEKIMDLYKALESYL